MSSINIIKKSSVGSFATTKLNDKVKIFNHFYKAAESKSNIKPMENYFG
jgi:hypothetical protein